MYFMAEYISPIGISLKCKMLITARKRSLWQGNIFIGVCQELCSRGGGLPQCMLGYHPTPGKADPPPGKAHPPSALHAGRYSQQASGMHPTLWGGGVCSRGCLGGCLFPGGGWWRPPRRLLLCCGRYASYWNAFLFSMIF